MAAQLGDGDEDAIVGINVTPLVDVMLVLLIIFLVTATYIVKPSIEVDLPKAASGGESTDTTLSIVLGKQGELFLNGEPTNEATLADRCKKAAAKGDDAQAIIAADGLVQHKNVVRIIDLIRLNGVLKFAININPVDAASVVPDGDVAPEAPAAPEPAAAAPASAAPAPE